MLIFEEQTYECTLHWLQIFKNILERKLSAPSKLLDIAVPFAQEELASQLRYLAQDSREA